MKKRQITIDKAKLSKENELSVSYEEVVEGAIESHDIGSTLPVHPDLEKAFARLSPHLAALLDQWTKSGEPSAKVTCRQFTISGSDDKRGVCLVGGREVLGGKILSLSSPFTFFLGDSKHYPDMKQLEDDLKACQDEIYEYIVNKKHKPSNQIALPFEGPDIFITNEKTAAHMVSKAMIEPGMKVLEPSAGDGALIREIRNTDKEIVVDFFEFDDTRRAQLSTWNNVNLLGNDFIVYNFKGVQYDRIVAHPPTGKGGVETAHIMKMYDLLKPGGRCVTLCSTAFIDGTTAKFEKFKKFLEEVNAKREMIDIAAVNAAGTAMKGVILILDKPEAPTE